MARTGSWILAVVTLFLVDPAGGALLSDYTNLMSVLFSGYDKGIRPRIDDTRPLYTKMGLDLLSITSLDEINQELTFACNVQIEWNDQRLRWVAPAHGGIIEFTYPQTNVWLPDVTIGNTVETLGHLGFDRNPVLVRSTGYVYWSAGGVFRTSCEIDVTYYPFDTQSCTVDFTTRISTIDMMRLNFRTDSVSTATYNPSGTWDLVSLEATTRPDNSNYTRVGFTMNMKRLQTYFIVSIIAPVTFLSLTSTLVFALPADSGEKMGTSITVLLSFAVYLTIVAEQMPKTSSHVSYLSIWLTSLLGMTSMGVVLTVWVLNLHFRDDEHPPGPIMHGIALFLRRLMFKEPWRRQVSPADENTKPLKLQDLPEGKRNSVAHFDGPVWKRTPTAGTEASEEQDEKPHTPRMTWQTVACSFDRFFFYFFTLFVIVSTVVFYVVMLSK